MAPLVVPADLLARIDATPRPGRPQISWEASIAGYLYLGGLGAGAYVVAVVAGWLGLTLAPARITVIGGWVWDWPRALVLWGPFATALGASLLIFHLGRNWSHFYAACKNPRTSWLARGFLILGGFILVGGVVAAVAVFLPSWPDRHLGLWRGLEAVGVVLAFGTAIYTGLLLRSIKYIPAWNAPFIPFLFLASALSTGAMGVLMGAMVHRLLVADAASAHGLARGVEAIEPLLIAIEATLLVLYVRYLKKGKPEGLVSARLWLSGSWRYGFWGGIVGLSLALPFALELVNLGLRSDLLAVIASASVLSGGFVLRMGVLGIGVKETPPLYKFALWRAQHPAVGPSSALEGP